MAMLWHTAVQCMHTCVLGRLGFQNQNHSFPHKLASAETTIIKNVRFSFRLNSSFENMRDDNKSKYTNTSLHDMQLSSSLPFDI